MRVSIKIEDIDELKDWHEYGNSGFSLDRELMIGISPVIKFLVKDFRRNEIDPVS
jgi:hypothetical protein